MSAAKKTLLFSDVHLKVHPEQAAYRADFVAFLRSIDPREFDRIICLGDLFDFWFEYRHVIFSEYFEVLQAFADLHAAGLELHLICGNHDFWAGRFLQDHLGFHIHQAATRLPFGDQQAQLVHGDGVNPEDRAYRVYKQIARNSLVISLFRLLHPDWAMALAQGVSHGSRTLRSVPNPEEGPESKALRRYARRNLAEGDFSIVICGHAHHPVLERIDEEATQGLYINTGDWVRHRSHVIWDGGAFHLKVAAEPNLERSLTFPADDLAGSGEAC